MTRRPPLVIVTLPGRSVAELRGEIIEARNAGADGAEVRLDRLAPRELALLPELFPAPLPLLATLRSRVEGGEGPDDVASRIERLLPLGALPFEWIDLEYDRDRDLTGQLRPPGGTILSSHLAAADLPDLDRRMRQPVPSGSVRKVVIPASIATLLDRVIPALPPLGETSLVVLTTGASGPLLRAWSGRLGNPLVFASLPQGGPREGSRSPVEPGQIPADRLRWFLDADEAAPVFGIAGHPVGHSASPYLHSRWMRHAGHRGLYVPLDFASDEEFVDSLPVLADRGFRGLNVTHPFKQAAFAAASRVGRGAEACGVANCLTFRGGEVEAENTDLAAMLRRLEELRNSGLWGGRSVTVLGAGGAARATLAAAKSLGAGLHLVARRPEAARALEESFGAGTGTPPAPRPGDLVVHATDAGRAGAGALDLPFASLVGPGVHVLDWVYRPDEPTIRSVAEAGGATYEDGWRLLVYQAASSFDVWWGAPPSDVEIAATVGEGV